LSAKITILKEKKMNVKTEKLAKSMAKLTIEVPAEEVEEAIERAYQKNKMRLSVPGFRKGKVPRPMLEKMYGKEIFYEEASDDLVSESYQKAVEECGETVVSSPKIEIVRIEAGAPFVYTAEVALKPEISLGKYKGVKIGKFDSAVTEEELAEALEKEQEKNARIIVVDDRNVEDGDMVILDFEGFLNEVPFKGGKGEAFPLTIGSGSFIPGFEEQLIGAEIGKETEVKVTFPEDYQAEELAGQAVVFKCTIREIKMKELPELDDEFAGEISDFETLAEYKEELKQKLTEAKEEAQKELKEDAVVDAIIEDSDIEIPEPMLLTQQRQMIEEFAQNIERQGMNIERYLQWTGMTPQEFKDRILPQAEKRIQTRLVMEAVAAAEGIEATLEDYEAELEKLADTYKMELDKVKELLNEKGKKELMQDIAVQKAVDFVVEHAAVGADVHIRPPKGKKKKEEPK
jgi:trigger factor